MLRILPLMLLTLGLLTACNSPSEAPKATTTAAVQTIAIVDTAKIFRESAPGKAGVDFLKSIQADMQIALATLQAKVQADPENMELQQEAQATFGQLQQRMSAEEQNVVNILNELVQKSLDEYRTTKNISVIVGTEAALSFDKTVDVTGDIIVAMDKHKVEYKSIMPEEEKAAPAAPEAAPKADAEQEAAPATEGEKSN